MNLVARLEASILVTYAGGQVDTNKAMCQSETTTMGQTAAAS